MNSPSASGGNTDQWAALVGMAIVRFGEIEYISIKCLAILLIGKFDDRVARRKFSLRADLIINLIEARTERDAHLNGLLEGFRNAKALAKTRNVIAHNPVMLNLYVNEDRTKSFAQHAIVAARSGNTALELEDLNEFAAAVDSLSAELWMHFTNVTRTSESLWCERASVP